ncbi:MULTISPECIES: MarR family winged helix-turn-helix transcriptional regulator [unclassified Luteococcus]|uniref:MarR family winged helix-turn-helix transcriptional regulator n=1 Tax=unclassified Luteococcus TaxID=2639923 RepID=UPI00313D26B1
MQSSEQSPRVIQLSEHLRQLCAASEHLSHACAEEQGIYLTDFRALLLIRSAQRENRTLTAGELATALNLSSGAVTYLVERLTQAGQVMRQVDPQDRRRVLLRSTERGLAAADRFFEPMYASLSPLSSQIDDAQMNRLLQVLNQINENLDQNTRRVRAGQGAA